MRDEILIRSLVSHDRVSANFSDTKLPRFARDGELYIVAGILYVYSDLDATDHGRWFPLTNEKEIYTYTQTELSLIWTLPASYHTNNIQIIIYDAHDKVYKGEYTVDIDNTTVSIEFPTPTAGLVHIVVNKAYDWVSDRFVIGDSNFVMTKDEADPEIYYIELDTQYIEILKNGDTTFESNVTINGGLNLNGSVNLQGDQHIDGSLSIGTNISVSGETTLDGEVNIAGDMTMGGDLLVEGASSLSGDLRVDGNTLITGDLIVTGETTTIQTEQLYVSDNIITLNAGTIGTPTEDAGIEVDRGEEGLLTLIKWDETNDKVVIPHDLEVTGAIELSDVTVSGGLNLNGLNATGDSNLNNVMVTGDTTLADLEVTGDSTLNGVIAESLSVTNNNIVLNSGIIGSPTENVSIDIDRGDEGILSLISFDETNDYVTMAVKQSDGTFIQEPIASRIYVTDIVDTERLRAEGVESELSTRMTTIESFGTDIQDQVDAEIVARELADNTLQTNISHETMLRIAGVQNAYDIGNHDHPYAATNGAIDIDFSGQQLTATTSLQTPIIYGMNDTTYFINLADATTSINCAGEIISASDVIAFSDESLKENVQMIPNAIDKVKEINGVTFTRNDMPDVNKRYTGVIAQQVEKVLPEAVTTTDSGIKGVSYGNMVGLLIEAVKEQQLQIDELKEEVMKLTVR